MINYSLFALLIGSLLQLGCCIEVIANFNPASVNLQNGVGTCQGLVKFHNYSITSASLQACNSDAGDNETKVICRQLNCDTENARRVSATEFGFSEVTYYTLFKYLCNGNETSLSECMLQSTVDCTTNDPASAMAIKCGEQTGRANGENSQNTRTGSKLIVIIMCSILGGVLVIVAVLNTIILLCCAHKRHVESGTDLYIY